MNVIHPVLLTLIKAVGSPYYFTEAVLTATIPRIGKTDSWPLQTKTLHLHDNPLPVWIYIPFSRIICAITVRYKLVIYSCATQYRF